MNPVEHVRATARLQLHRDFDFAAARAQVPYFAALGISHLYLSPILTARKGSTHGYDVVDHGAVNAELGGEDGLRELVASLRAHGMGLVVDIVPNHMAVGRDDNRQWLDVLEWGPLSRFASFFDIDWDVADPALRGRVLAPFLGKPYGEALAEGELGLRFDAERGRFHVAYYDHRFPLAPATYAPLLRAGGEQFVQFAHKMRDAVRVGKNARGGAFERICLELAEAMRDATQRQALDALLARFDGRDERGGGRERLHALLERQHYRLAWWRTAADEINWRRFFDIIDLAGIRIREPAAFEIVHATTFRLYREGLIDGVRIDHVDGLADPRAYCRKLRSRLAKLQRERPDGAPGGPAYLVVEKILAAGERLADDWGVDGTTGYSFMNEAGAVLHDPRGEQPLGQAWAQITGSNWDFEEEERRARRRIPHDLLAADFNACAHALHAIARSDARTRDITLQAIRRVLSELLVAFPVYRTYADARGRSPADAELMRSTLEATRAMCRPGDRHVVDLFDAWLGGEPPRDLQSAALRQARLRAIARFQQLSSPVAAKSVEDTAFYRHGRLLSRNEVGANPAQFALSVADFHAENQQRAERFPRAMLATATHDHKRGEDLRMRLAVLSEQPARWIAAVTTWRERNARFRSAYEEPSAHGGAARALAPDAADELMLYQMLVGAWPLDLAADDAAGVETFRDRIDGWMQKAVREAKRRSGWVEPNLGYEDGCRKFLQALLDAGRSPEFLRELAAFADSIAPAGASNALAQTLLRLTAPGVPDLYQGTEWWDFSLVDPDNRRPVDYAARARALETPADAATLMHHWRDGRIKQRVIARALGLRAELPTLFAEGRYLPLEVEGPAAGQVLAFARVHGRQAVVAAVTRLPSGLLGLLPEPSVPAERWQGTHVVLPRPLRQRRWREVLRERELGKHGHALPLAALLSPWPVALLAGSHDEATTR